LKIVLTLSRNQAFSSSPIGTQHNKPHENMGRIAKPDHIEVVVKIKHLKKLKRQQTVILHPALASAAFEWVIETLEATKIPDEPETQETVECSE